jgi:hypothetical protein
MNLRRFLPAVLLLCLMSAPRPANAYSLLTHEQLIDLTWKSTIVPLLLSRYPTLTPFQLEHARAYAYGGCVIQDIGYYPFGDAFFSDLTHYVRSGDFVVNLFRNAGNADELAFAVGALSHYIGDSVGHAQATNLAVPVAFPKLARRYGSSVNYAEGTHQHVQVEFAFDIDQIAQHRLAPVHYLRHVGLQVPTRQVSLAFYQTYGIREDFSARRAARINVGGYRFSVRKFIPRIAYAVTLLHRKHMPGDVASPEQQRLDAAVARVSQDNHWEDFRKSAGIGTYSLAGLIFILPKVGPLKMLSIKGPTSQTGALYVHSLLDSVDALDLALRRFTPPPPLRATADHAASDDKDASSPPARPLQTKQLSPAEQRDPIHPLANRDLDTGVPVRPAGYQLTDQTYAMLLHRIALTPTAPIPPGIKADITAYYADSSLNFATKRHPEDWAVVQSDLVALRAVPTSNELDPFPTYDDLEAPADSGK